MRDLSYTPPFFTDNSLSSHIEVRENNAVFSSTIQTLNFQGRTIEITGTSTKADIDIPGVIVDDLALRPAAVDARDCLFFADDMKYFSYSDGAAWSTLDLDIVDGTTGILTIARGGTGATTAAGARDNLDTFSKAEIIAFSVAL